jgi:DNA-binding transcriptional LysR family regulator
MVKTSVAKRVLAVLDNMENYAKTSKAGDARRLQIGFYTALAGPLSDTIFSFAQQYPKVDVNLIEGDCVTLFPLLDRGTIDIAVALGEPPIGTTHI